MYTVTSADGTAIAVERNGKGPPLVLVHGTGGHRHHWDAVAPELARQATIYAVDRRGRGDSGDAADGRPYAVAREVEDVLAVLADIGEPAHLLGHSYGAMVALDAASQAERLASLILYEPPLNVGPDWVPAGLGARLAALLAAGDRDGVLITFLREGPRLTENEIAARRAEADWPDWLAFVPTLPRETQTVERYEFDPAHAADVPWPTLLLLGGDSVPFFRQGIVALHAAMVGSELVELPGQQHSAMWTAPTLFTETVRRWMTQVGGG